MGPEIFCRAGNTSVIPPLTRSCRAGEIRSAVWTYDVQPIGSLGVILPANKDSRIVDGGSLLWEAEVNPRYRFAPGSENATKVENFSPSDV